MVKSRRNRILGIVGFMITLVVLGLIFPREGKFRYEYQMGTYWPHDDLYAPFDFPVKKTSRELEEEKKQAVKDSRPFLSRDTAMVSRVGKKIISSFDSSSAFLREFGPSTGQQEIARLNRFREGLKILIDSVYHQGIIAQHPELEGKDVETIVAVHGGDNIYSDHFLADFYTANTARHFLENSLSRLDSGLFQLVRPFLMYLQPDVEFDKETTERFRDEAIRAIPQFHGAVAKGDLVIGKDEYINAEKFNVIESLRIAYEKEKGGSLNYYAVISGQVLYIAILLIFLFSFLNIFRQKLFRNFRQTTSILVLLIIVVGLARVTMVSEDVSIYIVPFTILPILIRSFYDTRLALFVHIISVLLSAYFAQNSFEFVIIEMGGGITAIFSFVNFRRRQQLFNTVLLILLTYSLLFVSLTLMREGTLMQINYYMFIWFFLSCLATLFCFPLIYMFEKVFGLFSDVTLLELSDTNTRLLRELSAKAPGTFQHSIQVANLAEAAIDEIGGNALLVRTGALYHDIGKMEHPQYFIENQVAGLNPHDAISFDKSAEIIISHVPKGVEIAKKYKLPSIIIDFIRTHHGTQTVQYFYRNYIKKFPEAANDLDRKRFSYPGPIPFSKETAVLMMADSVEAASRSITEPSMEKIDSLVEKIIDYQVQENQFINSDITLRDIRDIKRIFKDKLMNIYHVRIEYPE